MRSGRNGASKPRNPYPAGQAPNSAQPQPSKVAGNCMEWTSGLTAACPIGSITTDADDASPPGPLASKRAVKRTPHCLHPSKELTMKANVSDEGRVPDMPQLNEAG